MQFQEGACRKGLSRRFVADCLSQAERLCYKPYVAERRPGASCIPRLLSRTRTLLQHSEPPAGVCGPNKQHRLASSRCSSRIHISVLKPPCKTSRSQHGPEPEFSLCACYIVRNSLAGLMQGYSVFTLRRARVLAGVGFFTIGEDFVVAFTSAMNESRDEKVELFASARLEQADHPEGKVALGPPPHLLIPPGTRLTGHWAMGLGVGSKCFRSMVNLASPQLRTNAILKVQVGGLWSASSTGPCFRSRSDWLLLHLQRLKSSAAGVRKAIFFEGFAAIVVSKLSRLWQALTIFLPCFCRSWCARVSSLSTALSSILATGPSVSIWASHYLRR